MENKKLCSTPTGEHLQSLWQHVAKIGAVKRTGQALWGLLWFFTTPEASKGNFVWWENQKKIVISAVPLYALRQVSSASLWG